MPAIVGGRIIGRLPLAAIAESRPRGFSGVVANSAPLPAGLTPQRPIPAVRITTTHTATSDDCPNLSHNAGYEHNPRDLCDGITTRSASAWLQVREAWRMHGQWRRDRADQFRQLQRDAYR